MEKVLVVDDVKDNITLLSFELEDDGFCVIPAYSGYECLEIVTEQVPDVILLDIRMPGIDGLQTLEKLKENESTQDIPVIMVSANSEGENIIRAIDLGAHDFVSKPIEYPVLAARMRSALRLSQALKELEIANNELNTLATQDPLTNCYNRRQFFKLSEAEVSKAHRHNRELSMLMMDIDLFKKINDTYGHAAGDEALKTMSDCCQKEIRESDVLGRLGGEEFALCCPDADVEGALAIAERIRETCADLTMGPEDNPFSMTVSIGVTALQPNDTIDTALKRADNLLYQAKQQGRNRCVTD